MISVCSQGIELPNQRRKVTGYVPANVLLGLAVLLSVLVNKNQRSGPENLLRFLRALQSVGPEQLQSPIIQPHIQSHVLWVPEAMLYRTEHPPKFRSPVGL